MSSVDDAIDRLRQYNNTTIRISSILYLNDCETVAQDYIARLPEDNSKRIDIEGKSYIAYDEYLKLKEDIDHAVKEAKNRVPDYPFDQNTASEAVWALGESLLGVEQANRELHTIHAKSWPEIYEAYFPQGTCRITFYAPDTQEPSIAHDLYAINNELGGVIWNHSDMTAKDCPYKLIKKGNINVQKSS